ncbi:MAG: acetyl-CoA acetyltransferase [Gammaproteobacteria bacterium]|nr:acetyl-CoA acetyltransferase [Gammaproteobacteria bacterium]
MTDQRETPILVGAAQLEQRIDDPLTGREPIELMIDAVQQAAADAGAPDLLEAASSVRVIRGIWPYQNPARAVAEAIGASGAETALTPYGGNFVQTVVNQCALEIQSGARDVIVITGAECGNTQAKARRAGVDLNWQTLPGTPDRMIGEEKGMSHQAEKALRIRAPIQIYPLFENALRYQRGESIEAHLERISELWAGFSRVAADNPHAWIRDARSAEEIRTISSSNRPVSFPYPKLMNSNSNVDQGAALIMCSTSKARTLGIPEDRWIYPWAGTDAHDHYYVSNRDNLYSSPAIRIAGRRVLELTGLAPGDLDLVDVYSCFPVAVQIAAAEIGLDTARPLTITGGLTFHGGPLNNYVMHAIARAVELLREQRGAKCLITANGGYLTKHAFGVYSTAPPGQPFRHEDVQAEVDATPSREVVLDHRGDATVESYTVMYGADGPSIAHVVCRTPDDRRAWANCEDPDILQAMTREEFCGRPVQVADHRARF